MDTTLIISGSIILLISLGVLIYYYSEGKIDLSGLTSKISTDTVGIKLIDGFKKYVVPTVLYVLGLWLIYLKCNPLWVAWHNPEELFWITNAMILIIAIWRRGLLWIVVGIMGGVLLIFIIGNFDGKEEFLKSGQGYATMEKPIKAYLDPFKSHTRIADNGNAKYVLAANPEKFFDCNAKPEETSRTWLEMPAGNYLIYPSNTNSGGVSFKWW